MSISAQGVTIVGIAMLATMVLGTISQNAYAFFEERSLNLIVGETGTAISCSDNEAFFELAIINHDPSVLETIPLDCGGSPLTFERLDVKCLDVGVAEVDVLAQNNVWDITVGCTMFVVPESPIGIIALIGSSLAALGGFMYWKRKQGSSQPHSIGDLGI